jgi:hypothetical protein
MTLPPLTRSAAHACLLDVLAMTSAAWTYRWRAR